MTSVERTYFETRRALRRAHTSATQCLIPSNISGPIHFWNFTRDIVFGPVSQWWRITLIIKYFSYRDPYSDLHQNWITLSSAHIQHDHYVSTKSIHNVLRYRAIYRFSPISQWWRITEKLSDPDLDLELHQNIISSSLSQTQPAHQISSESVHNFLRCPAQS